MHPFRRGLRCRPSKPPSTPVLALAQAHSLRYFREVVPSQVSPQRLATETCGPQQSRWRTNRPLPEQLERTVLPGSGNDCAEAATDAAAARVQHLHCWRSLCLGAKEAVAAFSPPSWSRKDARRYAGNQYNMPNMPTTAAGAQPVGSITTGGSMQTAPLSSSASPPASPSPSLQELLGISDAELEVLWNKNQVSKPAFNNLVKTSSGGSDDTGHGGGGSTEAGVSFDVTLPSPSSPQSPPSSCFPRFLLDDLRVEPSEIKSLVLRRPILLSWSDTAAKKVSRWLQERLGMRRSEVARLMLRHPEVATKTLDNVELKVVWLQDNLDLGKSGDRGVVKLLLTAPSILGLSIERSLEPMLRWLKDRLGLSSEGAAKVARANPNVFGLRVEGNLEPTLAWLQKRLNLHDESKILAMVAAAPNILSMNMHTGLEPKFAWLRHSVGLSPPEICELIGKEPTILYNSVRHNLDPTLTWLKEHLNLDNQAAREMILASPRLLSTSVGENLSLKLPWLQQTLGLDAGEAVALAQRAPAVLQYSINNNLEPTLIFFQEKMGASKEELRAAVLRNPKVLAYSLERRLQPRVAEMKRVKVQPVFSKHRTHVCLWADSKFKGFIERHRH